MFERSYLQNIIVNAPIGIITTDMGLRVTFISDSAKTAIGLSKELSKDINNKLQESPKNGTGVKTPSSIPVIQNIEFATQLTADPSEMIRHLEPVLRNAEQTRTFEIEINAAGCSRIVQFTISLLRDDSFVPIGLLLMCENVTEQRETARKYRNLMENSIDAVFIYKGEAVIEANPAFSRLTGKNLATQGLLKWENFICPESLTKVLDYARRRENGDTTVPDKFECFGIGSDGSKRFWIVSVSPVYPKLGIYAVLIHDQTEQKALEQQLIQTRRMETVSLLAGGIAHDFNNLLTGVLGYASLMKSVLKPKDSIYNYVNSIESSAMHAKELNDQLVAFARLGKYSIKPLELNRVTAKTMRLIRMMLGKNIEVHISFSENLCLINASAAQLQQLITNICINSSEAMPNGGSITIKTENLSLICNKPMGNWRILRGEYVHLSITDTGAGIEEKNLDKIFEPFFSTKGVGYGLGLAAAYGIVKGHNGYIAATSKPGKGTTIDVFLPTLKEMKEEVAAVPKKLAKGTGRILIVDDEEVVCEILGDILKQLGYDAITTDDGAKAIPLFEKEWKSIDVVFLDMIMPVMNGDETFHKMKQINPDVRVIVCTGYTEDAPIQEMLKQGAICVLRKPFRLDEITSVLSEAFAAHNSAKSY